MRIKVEFTYMKARMMQLKTIALLASVAMVGFSLAGCEDSTLSSGAKASRPLPAATLTLMSQKGVTQNSAMLIRTFKKEAEFEVWKQKDDGTFVHLKTFPMCRWSGQLGPKVREGDRQVPEGFYTITPGQMNPNSSYYLSFNVGYPNAYDQAYGRTGGAIMVHGICSSAGCYSMTDAQIAEIYALAREAFSGGQRAIQMESFPFHMTAENLAVHRLDRNMPFWRNLKEGSDQFEVTKREPVVGVCGKKYVFNVRGTDGSTRFDASAPCPALKSDEQIAAAVAEKQARDEHDVAELIAKGVKPIQLVYQDGGQNPEFRNRVSEMSRPEAIAESPTEIVLDESGKPLKTPPLVQQMAKAQPLGPVVANSKVAMPAKSTASNALMASAEPMVQVNAPAPSAGLFSVFQPGPSAAKAGTDKDKPFFKKWLPFGQTDEAPEIAVNEPDAPQPANVPKPPAKRAVSSVN